MRSRTGSHPTTVGLAGVAAGALIVGFLLPSAVDGQRAPSFAPGRAAGDHVAAPGSSDGPTDVPGEEIVEDRSSTPSAGSPTGHRSVPGAAGSDSSSTASGSDSEATGFRTPSSEAPAESAARTASDVGVTAEEIKLGFILLDLSTANSVGLAPDNYEVETQRRAYQVQVDAINAAGGLHGRQTRAVYAVADPFDAESALAACVKLTEDEKVFAVIAFAGYTADGMLCVGRQHRTPIIVFGWPPTEHFQLTGGRLVSDGMAGNRIMFNWVNDLHRLKLLAGKQIGIVGDENTSNGDKQAVEHGLIPALEQFGYEVTYRARLSESLPTAASQIPSQVTQMRSAGVDTVLLATTFLYATQWVQAAHGQGWRPQYSVSDLQGLTSDVVMENMPESFEGAYGFTDSHFVRGAREGMAEPAVDRTCRETYNRSTGEHWRWGDRHPLFNACVQMEIYRRTMSAAGPEPTRASWVTGIRGIGDFPLVTKFGGGLTGRNDYANAMSTIRWQARCTCFNTVEGPRPARF